MADRADEFVARLTGLSQLDVVLSADVERVAAAMSRADPSALGEPETAALRRFVQVARSGRLRRGVAPRGLGMQRRLDRALREALRTLQTIPDDQQSDLTKQLLSDCDCDPLPPRRR